MVGRPWEGIERIGFRELASTSAEYGGEKLKKEELNALREMFEARKLEELKWVLDDDIEMKEEWFNGEDRVWDPSKRRRRGEGEVIQFLVDRYVLGVLVLECIDSGFRILCYLGFCQFWEFCLFFLRWFCGQA